MLRADRISLRNMVFAARHGVLPPEKTNPQRFEVDVDLFLDLSAAGRKDALDLTVNYAEVYQAVADVVTGRSFDLVESVAEKVAEAVLACARDRAQSVRVSVRKPQAPIGGLLDTVEVEVWRRSTSGEGAYRPGVGVLAFVGLGSNLGDRQAYLDEARRLMREISGTSLLAASPVYETEPVGLTEQGPFLNQVAALRTKLGPLELLSALHDIERRLGRERTVRWGPRTVDLDLLLYGEESRADDALTLPHPRMWERGFVMVPLADLAPDIVAPDGKTVAALARELAKNGGIRPWTGSPGGSPRGLTSSERSPSM